MSEIAPFITDLPGGRRALPDRDRPFVWEPSGAMLAGCPDRASASALCPMIFTSFLARGRASAGRSSTTCRDWTVTDDWPDRVPITDAELDVFEAWFGDLFDELFGPRR